VYIQRIYTSGLTQVETNGDYKMNAALESLKDSRADNLILIAKARVDLKYHMDLAASAEDLVNILQASLDELDAAIEVLSNTP